MDSGFEIIRLAYSNTLKIRTALSQATHLLPWDLNQTKKGLSSAFKDLVENDGYLTPPSIWT
jgi:hypothetical protein